MSVPDMIDRFVEFSYILANILVFTFSMFAYQAARKRSLLMIAVSSAIATVLLIMPWIRADEPSWAFWCFHTLATICDLCLYIVGFYLLCGDYVALLSKTPEPEGAEPNGRPAPPA
jgi:hypothetical protein